MMISNNDIPTKLNSYSIVQIDVECYISEINEVTGGHSVILKGTAELINAPDIHFSDIFQVSGLAAEDLKRVAERKAFVEQKLRELAKAFTDGEGV